MVKKELNRNILLTGARAPVTLDLARYFFAAGYTVYLADSFEQSLAKASNSVKEFFLVTSPVNNYKQFIADLREIIVNKNIQLLIPTCEEVFYISKGKEELSAYCNVFCSELPFLLSLHNKYSFIRSVVDKGLIAPDTYLATNQDELIQALVSINSPAVIKPVYSRFASKVLYSNPQNPIDSKRIPVSKKVPYVVQKKITGRALCSYTVLHEGVITAHVVYDAEYTAGNGASIRFKSINHQEIRNWINTFFANSGVTGQYSFDFIESGDGLVYPLECNPRATSGVHLFRDRTLPLAFEGDREVKPNYEINVMIGLAMIIYGWKRKNVGEWVKAFKGSQDAIWSKKDKWPFIYQFISYLAILRKSRVLNLSPIEVSTVDIEWNGEDK